jgi:hypothetical protein
MPWRITIAAFTSATFPDDTAGSPKRWTTGLASPQSPRRSRLDGRLHLEFPFAGSRMLRGLLAAEGWKIGRRYS